MIKSLSEIQIDWKENWLELLKEEVQEMYRKFNFKKVSASIRYYFTVVGEHNVNILDRLTHKTLAYAGNFESLEIQINKLNAMTEDEYYDFVFSLGIRPQENKDAEEWFTGAWIYETDKILTKLNMNIPNTTINFIDLEIRYKEYNSKQKKKGWANSDKSEFLETVQTKQDKEGDSSREECKKTTKKRLLRRDSKKIDNTSKDSKDSKSNELAPEAPEGDMKQIELDRLTQLKADSKITFGEYVKMKREIIKKYGA